MKDYDFVLKDFASYPVPGMTNESHKNICQGIWYLDKVLNLKPHEYAVELLTT
jgi:hypothetical protein